MTFPFLIHRIFFANNCNNPILSDCEYSFPRHYVPVCSFSLIDEFRFLFTNSSLLLVMKIYFQQSCGCLIIYGSSAYCYITADNNKFSIFISGIR